MSLKKEWLVLIPDHTDALDKRIAVRPQHLEKLKPNIGVSTLFGGATLSEQVKEGDSGPPKMNGSFMLLVAEDEAEIRKKLEEDPYTHGGVWDLSKIQIWPFKTAVRVPLQQ